MVTVSGSDTHLALQSDANFSLCFVLATRYDDTCPAVFPQILRIPRLGANDDVPLTFSGAEHAAAVMFVVF